MSRSGSIIKRTLRSFYDDQMTHHAAALTYYGLMSLFPTLLLAISLLGPLGQYPDTYDSIIGYLREVAPRAVLVPLDSSLRSALQSKDTAATAVAISVLVALHGTTGVLEAARRALNVVFEVKGGRSFLRRKAIDVASTFVLGALVLVSLVMVFVGGGFAEDLLGVYRVRVERRTGLEHRPLARGSGGGDTGALIYYVTPDVRQRGFRWVIPGVAVDRVDVSEVGNVRREAKGHDKPEQHADARERLTAW